MDLPFGAPPILMELKSQVQNYLENPEMLPIHDLEMVQQYWKHETDVHQLCKAEIAPTPTTLFVKRDNKGEMTQIVEVLTPHAGMTNKTSMSLQRTPGPPSEWIRGNASNVPFWPGGLDWSPSDAVSSSVGVEALLEELSFKKDLKTVPPGFKAGMNFGTSDINLNLATALKPKHKQLEEADDLEKKADEPETIIDLANLLKEKGSVFKWISEEVASSQESEDKSSANQVLHTREDFDDIPVVDISKVPSLSEQKMKSTEWAEIIDVASSLDNFDNLVPNPAFTWPFELDRFQKHAIIHLEKGEDVFIAAHTSAGKTVIAEYAIALSQKHMTRAIYTSPIKALSNQKFRDFKTTFTDVGLLTGDVQINAKATCLIMTTEILRSMLYNGSDIIRDLEWVIFDEVHYINDSERGVVWEEVLILLPSHVNIVMLSATVPNTIEFATWVGRTKGRKMYVISTLKRPVPLEHYLYTGVTGKSQDERFLIVNADGAFVPKGYMAAMEAKKSKEKEVKAGAPAAAGGRGQVGTKPPSRPQPGGGHKSWGPPQEKNLLIALMNHLEKQKQLPVVVFTFSRNRCDQNSALLTSVNLVTEKERGRTHQFFQKCISRLKGSDQKLPQVRNMQNLLERGIGVHHSGILPILKEVVEMLFQEGLVKLLFATETFAMGVNMPARTVVFDTIRKHDGTGFRNLLPAEYIQMAGRAGRRGLDTTGTVIILCKNEVPESSELHAMMLGQPTKLSSQFRVTYSMILNLLRVEHLRVEDMMKRSFGEDHQQSKLGQVREKLQQLFERVQQCPSLACDVCTDIESYYNNAKAFLKLKEEMQESLLTHPSMVRDMCPGRVLIVQHQGECNKLAILLSIDSRSKEKLYKVLLLVGGDVSTHDDEAIWVRLLGVSQLEKLPYYPTSRVSHAVVSVKARAIWQVTRVQLKLETDKIIADWENRQIPRFKDNPPGPSCTSAVQEISRMSQSSNSIEVINPMQDWKWTNMDLMAKMQELTILRSRLASSTCVTCSQFAQHLQQTWSSMLVQEELQRTQFLVSEDSLQHSAEYHSRLDVLKELNYVDANGTLQMKGKVACEMGNHELIITELVFHNVLTELQPAEIAALLSCLVFQQKNASSPQLTPVLEQGRLRIREIAERIGRTQQIFGLKEAVGDFVDQFRFELAEVVYEWAKGLPFAEIMGLTDVQEGMIVRCIQRLDETLRDVRDAARIIGDPILYQKMEEASTAIKRDIVFAASLYTQ